MEDRISKNSNHEAEENQLGRDPIGKLLLKFALPSITSMVVNAIYNIVDQIFIGQGVGYLGNAATTIAFPIVTILLAVSTLIGAGGSAFASIKLGERQEREAERVLGNSFVISVAIGVFMMVAGLLFLDPLVKVFGASDATIEYARNYTIYILLAAPFNILGVVLSNFARTDGNPMLSMYSLVAGAVLNVILDPIFIFIFNWGVMGAALATAISQVLSAVILIWYFTRRSTMRFSKDSVKLRFYVLKNICSLGISSCVLNLATTILNIVLNNVLTTYGNLSDVGGDMALSAMGIVLKVSMIIISVCVGIGIGSQPILGFNKGANQPERVLKTYLMAAGIGLSVTILGWILCQTIPHMVLRIFEKENQTFMDFAVRCMRIYMGGVFVAGLQIVTTNYFQATGQPLKANIMSLLRQIIFLIPLLLILPKFMGLDGVLYSGMIADIAAGIVVFIFAVIEVRKIKAAIDKNKCKV